MALQITARLATCRLCPRWQNRRCALGHVLASSAGCPEGRFEPEGPRVPSPVLAPVRAESGVPCGAGCGGASTWANVTAEFTKAMVRWAAGGLALASAQEHERRTGICKNCPFYAGYRCQKCLCFTYVKAKLSTEKCPENHW